MSPATYVESSTAVETVEEAAEAISDALEFLRRESDAMGMLEVSELIERARAKADELRHGFQSVR